MDNVQQQVIIYALMGVAGVVALILLAKKLAKSSKTSAATDGVPAGKKNNHWDHTEALIVDKITDETHDIKSLRLRRSGDKKFSKILAGQFLSFQIGDDSKCLRSYSISTSSTISDYVEVSIKLLPDGIGSTFMHKLKEGDKVLAFAPSGLFTDEDQQDKEKVYVAGGIGITPILSMIRTNIDKGVDSKMSLFYGMKTTKDMAFHKEIKALAAQCESLHYYPVLSEADESWKGEKGFITLDYIQKKVKPSATSLYFTCGPEVMTDAIIENLMQSGVKKAQIFNEKFASADAIDSDSLEAKQVTINFNGSDYSYSGKESILEFMESEGESIVYACRAGVCGSCVCRLKSGEVSSITDAGLTEEDIANNSFLACVSFPKSDLVIEADN